MEPTKLHVVKKIDQQAELQLWAGIERIAEMVQAHELRMALMIRLQKGMYWVLGGLAILDLLALLK
jgi:hypothetical protein